jgi:hypothetical protein
MLLSVFLQANWAGRVAGDTVRPARWLRVSLTVFLTFCVVNITPSRMAACSAFISSMQAYGVGRQAGRQWVRAGAKGLCLWQVPGTATYGL